MKGRRGYLSDLAGGHRLFALAALHATRKHLGEKPDEPGLIGYVAASAIPMAVFAWIAWFVAKIGFDGGAHLFGVLFAAAALLFATLAVIGVSAWLYVLACIAVYVVAYIRAWLLRRTD